MTTPTLPTPTMGSSNSVELDYPMSLGSFEHYRDAQRLVDRLSDNGFPVQNVAIVGTGLRSVERVTGRLTRGKLAAGAALSGLWMGLCFGLAFALVSTGQGSIGFLVVTPVLGALFGLIWSQLGFQAITRNGTREFASVSQVLASSYEVIVEHKYAADAHLILDSGAQPADVR